MSEKNLDEVIGSFSDGNLTREEFLELMRDIRKKEDYIAPKVYASLLTLAEKEGTVKLTKYQFVQCREYALFAATGVTRG